MLVLVALPLLQASNGAGLLLRRGDRGKREDWHWQAGWDVTVPDWNLPVKKFSSTISNSTIVPTGDAAAEHLSLKMNEDLKPKLEADLTTNILNSIRNPEVVVAAKMVYDKEDCKGKKGKARPDSAQSLLKAAAHLSHKADKAEMLMNGGAEADGNPEGTAGKDGGAVKVATEAAADPAKAAKLGTDAAKRSVDLVAQEVEKETSRMLREANSKMGLASPLMDVPNIPVPYPHAVHKDPFKP